MSLPLAAFQKLKSILFVGEAAEQCGSTTRIQTADAHRHVVQPGNSRNEPQGMMPHSATIISWGGL
jgi:hypothetical protein